MAPSPLYAIVDLDTAARYGRRPSELAREYLTGGARWLQVRAKTGGSAVLLDLAGDVVRQAGPVGATIVVNDRADIAALAGAAGVHVGQDDLTVGDVRRCFPTLGLVGLSTHTRAQIDAALREDIGYLAVGPVFETATKQTGYRAVGLDLVRYAWSAVADRRPVVPVVAIGGITLETAPCVIEAGASAVAVISDLVRTGDPVRRVADYLGRLRG